MKKITLICLLDKKYPPDHSFVTGMLAQALPDDGDVRVQLLVMALEGGPLAPRRYHRAACLPMIPYFSRRGGSRVRGMLTARHLVRALIDDGTNHPGSTSRRERGIVVTVHECHLH